MMVGSVEIIRIPESHAWNEVASAAMADAFVFLDGGRKISPATLSAAAEELTRSAEVAGVIVTTPGDDPAQRCWRDLPAAIAALARPWPAVSLLCIRKTVWEQTGRCPDGPAPLWQWMAAAAHRGHRFATSLAASAADLPPQVEELPALAPARPARDRTWLLEQIRGSRFHGVASTGSDPDAVALRAGLLQLHDALDESHSLSQSVEGRGRRRAGDYWHGIMHRREPDDSNAKYWFRQVGRHPVFAELQSAADAVLARCEARDAARWRDRLGLPEGWDPLAFVDLCSHCRRSRDVQLEIAARRIQLAEMLLLLIHTYRDAAGVE